MSNKTPNRRNFLKLTGLAVVASVTASQFLKQSAHAQAGKPDAKPGAKPKLDMMKPTDSQAVTLGYYEDAAKVDGKKWPKRAGEEGQKQFCWNCQFYNAGTENAKSVAAAPCVIFAGKGVTGSGWCNSWTLNPKAK